MVAPAGLFARNATEQKQSSKPLTARRNLLDPNAPEISIEVGQKWEIRERCYAHCVKGTIREHVLLPRGIMRIVEIRVQHGQHIVICLHGGLPGWLVWFTPEALVKGAEREDETLPDFIEWEPREEDRELGGESCRGV